MHHYDVYIYIYIYTYIFVSRVTCKSFLAGLFYTVYMSLKSIKRYCYIFIILSILFLLHCPLGYENVYLAQSGKYTLSNRRRRSTFQWIALWFISSTFPNDSGATRLPAYMYIITEIRLVDAPLSF